MSDKLPGKEPEYELDVECGLRIIMPEDAEKLLGTRPNRQIRAARVNRLVSDLVADNWEVNGETVVLNERGELLDGQHRLRACIEADLPLLTFVVAGVADTSIHTLDIGMNRSLADTLKLAGAKNFQIVGTIIGTVCQYRAMIAAGRDQLSRNDNPTVAEALKLYHAEPEIADAASAQNRSQIAFPPYKGGTRAVGLIWHECDVDLHDEVDDFYYTVRRAKTRFGEPVAGDAPSMALRNALLQNAASVRRLPSDHVLALHIKAWNAHLAGDTIKQLKYRRGTSSPERFPRITTTLD